MFFQFDPTYPADRDAALKIIAAFTPGAAALKDTTAAVAPATEQPAPATEQPAPPSEQPAPATAEALYDSAGVPWNPECHTSNHATKADGSWKMRPGAKDAYEAHAAAHAQSQTNAAGATMQQSAPAAGGGMPTPGAVGGGMPTPGAPQEPATPTTNAPPPPITFDAMLQRFGPKVASHEFAHYNQIYADLHVDYDTMSTDQTSIARLWHYMDAWDNNGGDHVAAVQHAMNSAS